MRFGKSKEEAEQEPSRSGGGGGSDYMRYLRAGDNLIQVIDEPSEWKWYWEHYNPGGYPYPCNSDDRDNCPGCQSDDERVSKASRKVAFNALSWSDAGDAYVNVWKVPKTVADKLEARYDRQGTITNRPYLITQFKKDNGFFDYDIEGQDKQELEYNEEYLKDPEDMLAAAWEEAHGGDSALVKASKGSSPKKEEDEVRAKIKKAAKPEPQEEVSEADLRKMEFFDLVNFCKSNGFGTPKGDSVDEIVDWMLEQ